jgi:hypothetical protein
MEKKNPNYINGNYLVEHCPREPDPFVVWDLRRVFDEHAQGFTCRTNEEADALIAQLQKVVPQ